MVDENAPAATMATVKRDFACTYAPNCAARPAVPSDSVTEVLVGTTVEGAVMVKFLLTADPIFVLPLYVVTVTFAVPLVAFGMAFNQLVGMAYDVDVPTLLIVLELLPKLNTTVCVKLLEALVTLTVTVFVPLTATEAVTLLMVDALAMVSNVPFPLAVMLP